MEFRKNELTNDVVNTYAESFSQTCGLAEYVPQKSMKKIYDTINHNMVVDFKKAERQYKKETSSGFVNKLISFVTAPFRIFTVASKLDRLLQVLASGVSEELDKPITADDLINPLNATAETVEPPTTQSEDVNIKNE